MYTEGVRDLATSRMKIPLRIFDPVGDEVPIPLPGRSETKTITQLLLLERRCNKRVDLKSVDYINAQRCVEKIHGERDQHFRKVHG